MQASPACRRISDLKVTITNGLVAFSTSVYLLSRPIEMKRLSLPLGYLGFEYPASWLLQRLPLAKYSGTMIILWGIVLTCFAGVQSFAGAVVIRLLLGICEASVSPGWALFTSQVSFF